MNTTLLIQDIPASVATEPVMTYVFVSDAELVNVGGGAGVCGSF